MKVNFSRKFDKNLTYQEEFQEREWCRKCNAHMYPVVQIADDQGEIAKDIPLRATLWIHDVCVIVVYQCGECMEMKAVYNQG